MENINIPRLALIQALIDKNHYNNYLEIGVSIGTVFFRIRCRKKAAVDPEFGFNKFKIVSRSARLGNFSNLSAKYFEKTSDKFFEEDAGKLYHHDLDICLVDGMHEFSYALNDIQHTLDHMSDNGVIVIHDCNPRGAENACSFNEWKARGFTGEWNGDVWKSIVYLRSLRNDIDVFVADIDYGLGIVRKKPAANNSKLSFRNFEEIDALDFSQLEMNRQHWLNLQPPHYLNDYFGLKLKFS